MEGADDDDGNPVPRPPSLRDMLDAGCDLVATGVYLEGLAEELYDSLPILPPNQRAGTAACARAIAEDLIEHGRNSRYAPRWKDRSRGPRPCVDLREYLWWNLWRAEMYEDEDIAERLRQALPTHLAEHGRVRADLTRRPHPLEVRIPEMWWHCNNCGASFDQGEQEAVVVTYREGHSDLDYEITYCFDCIGLVAEVTRQADGS